LENGKKATGHRAISTTVTIWKSRHGGEGQVHHNSPTTQTLNSVSMAIRLKKYAPTQ
jgi:hypothetical protein